MRLGAPCCAMASLKVSSLGKGPGLALRQIVLYIRRHEHGRHHVDVPVGQVRIQHFLHHQVDSPAGVMDVRRGLVPLFAFGKPHRFLPRLPAVRGPHDAQVALVADDIHRIARRERPRMDQRHVAPVLPGLAAIIARIDLAVPQASIGVGLNTGQFLNAIAPLIHRSHQPPRRQQRQTGTVRPYAFGIGGRIDSGLGRGNGDRCGWRGLGAGRRGGEKAACGNGLDEGSAFHGESCTGWGFVFAGRLEDSRVFPQQRLLQMHRHNYSCQ